MSNINHKRRLGMIYFIQNGKQGPIKIGYTKGDVEVRLSNLQSASPCKLYLLGTMVGDKAVESRLHKKFDVFNTAGEWFKPDRILIDYIRDISGDLDQADFDVSKLYGSLDDELQGIEVGYIRSALIKTGNNITRAAIVLGISFRSLRHRISKYTISTKR